VGALEDVLGSGRPERIDVLVPDCEPVGSALTHTTVLGVGAHPDDLELGGAWGVVSCAGLADRWFTGVTCTDGAGSARGASTGGYGLQVQLGHTSTGVRDPAARAALVAELACLIEAARPSVVLGHDPFDRHATHAAVAMATVAACRSLPPTARPERLLGVEGWRSLDWLAPADRVRLDVSGHDELLQALLGCFPSQLEGKRYDRAGVGRRRSNATFDDETALDTAEQVALAVDLTPLVVDETRPIAAFLEGLLDRARLESLATLRSVLGPEA
jgi:LmbE family N-acetylglucosaminyl deacetylase